MSNLIKIKKSGMVRALQDHFTVSIRDACSALNLSYFDTQKSIAKGIKKARALLDEAEHTNKELRKLKALK